MRGLLTRRSARSRGAVAALPRAHGNRAVGEVIRRQDKPQKQGPAATQLATGVLRSAGFGDWHYVAYLDQKTVLLARNVASGNRERRIGSIPWITRNPGNITVSQEPEQKVGPGSKEAFKQGAYGKGGATQQDQDTLRYAVFPSVAEGLSAIWPQLVVLNRSNGGKLTLLGAMKIFKGVEKNETAAVKDSYVAEIAALMTDIILEHGDSAKGADTGEGPTREQARADALAILNAPMSALDGGDVRYEIARDALVQKEGGLNAPGITYRCDGGFLPNDAGRYGKSQWSAIEALKSSAPVAAELSHLLGCA